MSEKLSTPEMKTSTSDIPKALQIEEIDKLRTDQSLLEGRLVMEAPFDDPVVEDQKRAEARSEGFKDLIEAYLKKHDIDKDDDPEEFKEYSEFLREHSVDVISDSMWENGNSDDDASISERAKTSREIAAKYSSASTKETQPGPSIPPQPTPPATQASLSPTETLSLDERLEKQNEALAKIKEFEDAMQGDRQARHAAFAARMAVGTLAFRKRKKRQGEFEAAESVYQEKLRELELRRIELAETYGSLKKDSENEAFIRGLETRTNKLKAEDFEAQREHMLKQGGLKAKLLEKYANMDSRKKILLGVAAGTVLAASGVGIGVAAAWAGGAVGTLIGGAGAGLLATAKGYRTHATVMSRMFREGGPEALKLDRSQTRERALEAALGNMRSQAEKDIKSADRTKAAALALGVGSVALGSWISYGHFLDDRPSELLGGKIGGAIEDMNMPEATAPPAELDWKIEVAPTPEMEFSPEASKIFAGDGGYDLFNRMDIPQEHWGQLWDKVGPDLANVKMSNGVPFGYEMPNGEWGVRMPPVVGEGVPKEALEMIANKHQELFGSNPALPNGGAVEVVSEQHLLPPTLDHSPLTASDVDVLQEALKEGNMSLDASAINAHPEVFNKLSFVGKGLDLHTYATEALGLPDRWASDVEELVKKQLEATPPNSSFTSVFERANGEIVFRGGGKIPPEVLAQLFNSVPPAVRIEFALAG